MATILFPLDSTKVKWDSSVTQSWDVTEQTAASGKRRAITSQTLPAWQFDLTFPGLTKEERDDLFAFYYRLNGSLTPFFYKDAENYLMENQALPRNDDGSYQLVTNIGGQVEPVYYADNLTVTVDGAEYDGSTYVLDDGAIVFTTAPSDSVVVKASYEYYWKVVFAKSSLTVEQVFDNIFNVSFSLKVVR